MQHAQALWLTLSDFTVPFGHIATAFFSEKISLLFQSSQGSNYLVIAQVMTAMSPARSGLILLKLHFRFENVREQTNL